MEYLGLGLAIFVGISLGLTGSGGAILAVPILVYIMRIPPEIATFYSLFIVGFTALIGVLKYVRQKLISYEIALGFAIPSVMGVLLARKLFLPQIPDTIFTLALNSNFLVTKRLLLMILFSLLMLLSSVTMIRDKKSETGEITKLRLMPLVMQGMGVGFLTGLVGAGGGFLIIPALVKFAKIPIYKAIGTSLFIITLNSWLGFVGDIGRMPVDWMLLLSFTLFTALGIIIGGNLAQKVPATKLKPIFGWFVLCIGSYILIKEIFFA
ncbi:MAG: sulfite exporter TauE/SafE family protein [Bacteroidia bacterium]|nr:sulfite exporter TauE/SafE family protein [Bacteroidia bacterium]MDW8158717.1 sulfite exporter TauE/SafE family protein [Bacteroidia bacterium]